MNMQERMRPVWANKSAHRWGMCGRWQLDGGGSWQCANRAKQCLGGGGWWPQFHTGPLLAILLAWTQRWRQARRGEEGGSAALPSASGKRPAQIDSRVLREKAAAARQERSVAMEATAQRGGRGHGGSQTQTQIRETGFTSRITENERKHSSIEGRIPAAKRLGLPDAAVWAAERLGCTAAARTAA